MLRATPKIIGGCTRVQEQAAHVEAAGPRRVQLQLLQFGRVARQGRGDENLDDAPRWQRARRRERAHQRDKPAVVVLPEQAVDLVDDLRTARR